MMTEENKNLPEENGENPVPNPSEQQDGAPLASGKEEEGTENQDEAPVVQDQEAGSPDDPTEMQEAEKPEQEQVAPESTPETNAAEVPQHGDAEETTVPSASPESETHESEPDESHAEHKDDDSAEHDDDHEDEDLDFSHYTLPQLIKAFETAKQEQSIPKISKVIEAATPVLEEISAQARKEALDAFVEEGGDVADFDFRKDEDLENAEALLSILRDLRTKFYMEQTKLREKNYQAKQELLEQLRELIDGDETTASMKALKELQEQWKMIGPVPTQHNKTLWANYNALLDRYYDNRSIYFELKELDRRKNLEAKEELVKRARELASMENVKEAVKELNTLHEEFKHIGPVPKEVQEDLWQRFKAASDAIYEKRKEFVEDLKKELHANLEKKLALIEKIKPYLEFDSESIKEWNAKTKELLQVQKEWEAIGGLPRKNARDVNKQFWGSFKTFFGNKNAFFKRLDAQREDNLKKKQELVEKARALQESEDWNETANKLKELQKEWKTIGAVPDKYRESVFRDFKAACDHFFDRRRRSMNEEVASYQENYDEKKKLCEAITTLANTSPDDIEALRALVQQHTELGFVPKSKIKEAQQEFDEAIRTFLDKTTVDKEEKERLSAELNMSKLASGPNADRKIRQKQQQLRKQINAIEDDISLWKNNMGLFAASKTADKIKDEFEGKIEKAQKEVSSLKQQLRALRNL